MTAIAAARLGLSVALVAPVGSDFAGRELLQTLESEGVRLVGPRADRTPTTVLMPLAAGVAMATHLPHADISADEVTAIRARAVVLSLGRLALRPPEGRCYAVTGGIEIGRFGAGAPPELAGVEAVIMAAGEASVLTGQGDPERAASSLARTARAAIVTLGPDGAVGAAGDAVVQAPGVDVDAVDATGAGDLFVGAYAWADLLGLPLEPRLCWATLYAALSVRTPTPLTGAVGLQELIEEGRRRGLPSPLSSS